MDHFRTVGFIAVVALSVVSGAAAQSRASIDQLVESKHTGERSDAALEQVLSGTANRGSIEQIDPSLRVLNRDEVETLAANQRTSREGDCGATAEQQAIAASLQAQGRILADECEWVSWLASRSSSDREDDRYKIGAIVTLAAGQARESELEQERLEEEKQARFEAQIQAAMAASAAAPSIVGGD